MKLQKSFSHLQHVSQSVPAQPVARQLLTLFLRKDHCVSIRSTLFRPVIKKSAPIHILRFLKVLLRRISLEISCRKRNGTAC